MDNRVFNVNGFSNDMLLDALELAFKQQGDRTTAKAWMESKEHGLILCWAKGDKVHSLPSPLSAEECLPIVRKWLDGEFAKTVEPDAECEYLEDFEVTNRRGWQVYVNKWGHVGQADWKTICAIRPAYLWYGK